MSSDRLRQKSPEDRPTRLRWGATTWAAIVLLPLTMTGAMQIVIDHMAWPIRLAVFSLGLACTLALASFVGARVLGTLSTVSDLLGALREGDFGMRGRVRHGHDPLQDLIADVNLLSDALREGRRKRTETSRFRVRRSPRFAIRCSSRMKATGYG